MESVLVEKWRLRWKYFVKKYVLNRKWKNEEVIGDESEASTQEDDAIGVGRRGSKLRRQGDAYRMERSVIRNDDDVGWWARVIRNTERMLQNAEQ